MRQTEHQTAVTGRVTNRTLSPRQLCTTNPREASFSLSTSSPGPNKTGRTRASAGCRVGPGREKVGRSGGPSSPTARPEMARALQGTPRGRRRPHGVPAPVPSVLFGTDLRTDGPGGWGGSRGLDWPQPAPSFSGKHVFMCVLHCHVSSHREKAQSMKPWPPPASSPAPGKLEKWPMTDLGRENGVHSTQGLEPSARSWSWLQGPGVPRAPFQQVPHPVDHEGAHLGPVPPAPWGSRPASVRKVILHRPCLSPVSMPGSGEGHCSSHPCPAGGHVRGNHTPPAW